MDIKLHKATPDDLVRLVPLVRAYHAYEGFPPRPTETLSAAIKALLVSPDLGFIGLILTGDELVGYIAICYGYSIEFGGRDGFVDEFFISEAHRGQGIGRQALEAACQEARKQGVQALHLEVARHNHRAQSLYDAVGFQARTKYHIMSRNLM